MGFYSHKDCLIWMNSLPTFHKSWPWRGNLHVMGGSFESWVWVSFPFSEQRQSRFLALFAQNLWRGKLSLSLSIAPSNSWGPQANEAVGTNLTSGLRVPTHVGRQSYSQHGFLKYEPIQESGENIGIGGWTFCVQLFYKVCSQVKFTYFFFLFLKFVYLLSTQCFFF